MKDLSLVTKKDRKKWICITIFLGIFSFVLMIFEWVKFNTCFSIVGIVIEIINFFIIPKIKSKYHRGEQIIKIFEECNEEEKEEIYKFIKKFDKEETL